jgi:hypothetical protein
MTMNRKFVAKELVGAAKELVQAEKLIQSAEEDDGAVDEAFASTVRGLRSKLTKLAPKKNRRLRQYGVGMIKPNGTVKDLVDALAKVLAEA